MKSAGAQRLWRGAGAGLMVIFMAGDTGSAQSTQSAQAAPVTVEKVTCINLPNCYKLANGEVEVVVTTDIGPRVMRYGLVGGDNILGEVPGSMAEKDKNTWQSWGGHRLWIAPEGQP